MKSIKSYSMLREVKGAGIGLMVLVAMLCFSGQSAAFTTHNTTVSRSFDKLEDVVGGSIRVKVTFSNLERSGLRGFYSSDHIPQGLLVTPESVSVNGSEVTNYTYEFGGVNEFYAGCITYRWILETPTGFLENNPVPSSGGSVEIVYLLSSAQSGLFALNDFSWVGYYQSRSAPAFGHSEASDTKVVSFSLVRKGDLNNNGVVDLEDAILALKVIGVPGSVDQLEMKAEVNGDGKIGIEEVIYILGVVSGIR